MAIADASPPPLKLRLFGAPQICWRSGDSLELTSAKARALLYYLAMTGRVHTRAALAGLLWGDQAEAAARANLRRALLDLSTVVGPYLAIERQTVAMRDDCPLWIDAIEFAAKVTIAIPQVARQQAGAPQLGPDVESLEHTVALYRGDFLEGFYVRHAPEFESWMLAERVRLRDLLLQAMETLAQWVASQGDLIQAIGYIRRLLALEPWREEAHRQLMAWLAQSGQRSAALAQYEICCRALAEELDVAPAPETVHLHKQIRTSQYEPAPAQSPAGVPLLQPAALPARPDQEHSGMRRVPTNLPVLRDQLIGREQELASVQALLVRDEVGLVTLTGPGGVGKTQLALTVASALLHPQDTLAQPAFPDGIWLVDLAPLSDAALVLSTVAQVLKVRGGSGQGLQERLRDYLQGKHLLLVLDNFEHVVASGPLLTQLLSETPGVKALVTSRMALRVRRERVLPVPPLAVPALHDLSNLSEVMRSPAVALFVERAQEVLPDLVVTPEDIAAIAEICIRLDGLPLAIELAAARIKLLRPHTLLARLQRRLQILTGGPRDLPTRQQTLRATIDWSYQLLKPGEQRLLARLAVFAGGWTLEAAEAVCDAGGDLPFPVLDGLHALVDKSVIGLQKGEDGEFRLHMLESIREFSLERLHARRVEAARVWRAYAGYYLGLAEEFMAQASGERVTSAWLDRLERELDNFRAVLQWAAESQETAVGLRLAWALHLFWFVRGYYREERGWLRQLLALADDTATASEVWARALLAAGILAAQEGDFTEARRLLDESQHVFRKVGKREELLLSLRVLGYMLYEQGHYATAQALFAEALAIAQAANDRSGMADAWSGLGWVALMEGKWEEARTHFEEALAISQVQQRHERIAESLAGLGYVAITQQNYTTARGHFEAGLAASRRVAHRLWTLVLLTGFGIVHVQQRKYAAAQSILREGLLVNHKAGEPWRAAYGLIGMCVLAAHTQQPARALCLAAAVTTLRDAMGAPLSPLERILLALGVPRAQQALSQQAADAARAQGQAMNWDQVIRYALAEGPPEAATATRHA